MNVFDFQGFLFYYIVFFIFMFGACVGSFLNVVVLRAFSGESIVLPPSKCPHCKNKLKWYHNIPILSYLFLRGKCGFCKEKISPQYPIVEFITAVLFVCVALAFGLTLKTVFLFAVIAMCIVLSVTDILDQSIFTLHTYILAGIGLVYNFFDIGNSGLGTFNFNIFSHAISINQSFIYAIAGILLGAFGLEALVFVLKLIFKRRAFGDGDSYILGALGAVLLTKSLPVIFILGAVLQCVVYFPMFIKKFYDNKAYNMVIAMILFVVSLIGFKTLEHYGLMENFLVFLTLFVFMFAVAIYLILNLFRSVRTGTNLGTIPFGPPLIVAAILIIFFPQIVENVYSYFHNIVVMFPSLNGLVEVMPYILK